MQRNGSNGEENNGGATDTSKFPLPMPDDLFTTLNSDNFFSHLDLSGFQSVMVQKVNSIYYIFGLFQQDCQLFSINTAPANFH